MDNIDITATHNELLKASSVYVSNLEKMAFNRKEGSSKLIDEVNQEIDEFLIDSGRKFELFITDLDYVALSSPESETMLEGVETDDDMAFAVVSDSGINIVGNKIKISIDWSDVKYFIRNSDSFFTVEMLDGGEIYMSNVFLIDVLSELLLNYNSNSDGVKILVLQELTI